MNFWERVETEREFQGISRKELAQAAGISVNTIAMGKVRESIPLANIAIKIAKRLHISVEYLVTGAEVAPELELNTLVKYRDLIFKLETLPENVKNYALQSIEGLAHLYTKH